MAKSHSTVSVSDLATACARIYARSRRNGDCLEWTGPLNRGGYGNIDVGGSRGRTMRTHRVVYEHIKGPIPENFQIDHLCRNRACFNPEHLEAVDQRTNNARSNSPTALNSRKTHCKVGHKLSVIRKALPNGSIWRVCRICHAAEQRRRATRKKLAVLSNGGLRSTGYFGIPGSKLGRDTTRVHFVLGGKPICGSTVRKRMEFQHCASGFEERYVECGICRATWLATLRSQEIPK